MAAQHPLPGDPVVENPDHVPIVPPIGGLGPWCSCGWSPRAGQTLADHLNEMKENNQ